MTPLLDQLTPPEQALGRLAVELHLLDANSVNQAASLVMQRRVNGEAIGLDQMFVATGMLPADQVKQLLQRAQGGPATPSSSGQVASGQVPAIGNGSSPMPAVGSGSYRAVNAGARPGGTGGTTRNRSSPLTPGARSPSPSSSQRIRPHTANRSPSGAVPAYKSGPALAAVAPPPPPPVTSPAHSDGMPRSAEPADDMARHANGLLESAQPGGPTGGHAAPTMTMLDSPDVPQTAAVPTGAGTLTSDPRLSDVASRIGVDVQTAREIISKPTLAFPMTQSGGASSTGSGSGSDALSSSAGALPVVGVDVNIFAQVPVPGASTKSIAEIAQRTVDLPGEDDEELKAAKQKGMPNLSADTNPAQRYTIGKPIARGGMGAILSALDPYLRRQVAIKVMLPQARAKKDRVERFLEEAQVTGQLEHPNIVPVHELGLDPSGAPYFTMKLVKGKSLAEVLRGLRRESDKGVQPGQVVRDDKGKVRRSYTDEYSLARLLQVFLKVCDAIGFAHSKGVVHRDIKPDNLMLGSHGEVLVMDWGLAKVLKQDETTRKYLGRVGHTTTRRRQDGSRTGVNPAVDGAQPDAESVITDRSQTGSQTVDGAIAGTPAYMAPEQALGEIDRIGVHTDIYALGAILYELLSLRAPFEGTVPQILKGVAKGELKPPSERAPERRIPQDLEAVVMKAMAHRPGQRYPFVSALADDVLAFIEGRAVSAAQYSRTQAVGLWLRRNKMVAVAAAAGILALIAGAVLVAFVNQQAEAARVQELVRDGDHALEQGEVQLAYEKFLQAFALDSSVDGISDRIAEASQQVAERERRARAREIIAEADALFDSNDFSAAYRKYVAAQAQAPDIFSEEQQRRLYRAREFQDRLTLIDQARSRLEEAENAFIEADFAAAYTGYLAVYGTAPELMGEDEERHMQVASAFVGRELVDAENRQRGRELFEEAQQLMEEFEFVDAHERLLQAAAFCPGDEEILDLLVVAQQFKRAHESEDLIEDLLEKGDRDTQLVSMQIAPLMAEWERIRNIRGINAAYTITQQAIERDKLEAHLADFRTQLELAIETFRQILLINPRDPRPYDRIAGAYMLMFTMAQLIGDEAAMDEVRDRMRALGDGEWYEFHRHNLEFRTTLIVNTQPAGARVYAFRFEPCHDGRLVPVPSDATGRALVDAMDPQADVTATARQWRDTGTVYRLDCDDETNLCGTTPLRLDGVLTGSYLLVIKADGYEDVRYPVHLERNRPVAMPQIPLLRPNQIPPGFVYVPAGSYIRGGDAEVAGARASERVVVPRGFLMQRDEVTLGDLVPMIETYVQQHGVEIARQMVPRFQGTLFMDVTDAGQVWLAPEREHWPAMGQAYWGVERYLQFRSGLDGRAYRLPTDLEWEYAARGPDERLYPWGNRFHPGWAVMRDTYEDPLPQPIMRERGEILADESPFGIRDMAGGAAEWCSDPLEGDRVPAGSRVIRAGANNYPAFYCRVTYRWGTTGDVYAPTVAFRMVLDLP